MDVLVDVSPSCKITSSGVEQVDSQTVIFFEASERDAWTVLSNMLPSPHAVRLIMAMA